MKSPYVLYSPLAGLGCSLLDGVELLVAVKPTPETLHSTQESCTAAARKEVAQMTIKSCIGPTAECSCVGQYGETDGTGESDHP